MNRTFRRRALLTLFLAGILVFMSKLWQGDVRSDALVYAEVAKELLKGGNPLILTFSGKPYFNKPPFLFWLTALNYKLFGINTFSVKFWPAFFGVLSGMFLYFLCRRFMDEGPAFFAGLVLLFTRDFIKDNVMFHFESSVVFFTLASIYVLTGDWDAVPKGLVSGFLLGCALLCKGFPGYLGPVVVLATMLASKEMREVVPTVSFMVYVVFGSLMFSLWFFAEVHMFGGSFVNIFLGREVIERATSMGVFSKGKLYYLKEFVRNYWPWIATLPFGVYMFFKYTGSGWPKVFLVFWFLFSLLSILPLRPEYGRYLNYIYPITAIPSGFFIGSLLKDPGAAVGWILKVVLLGFIVINVLPIRLHRSYYRNLREVWPLVKNAMTDDRMVFLYRPPSKRLGQAILFYFDTSSRKVGGCQDVPPGGVVLTRERFAGELPCLRLEGTWKGYAVLKRPSTSRPPRKTPTALPFRG